MTGTCGAGNRATAGAENSKIRNGYSRLQIGMHWATVLLIGARFLSGAWMAEASRAVTQGLAHDATRAQTRMVAGLAAPGLAVLRVAFRRLPGVPGAPSAGSRRMEQIGDWTHKAILGLLGLLGLVPLSGLAAWDGGVALAGGVHGLLTDLLFALVFLHAGAATYHQHVMHDNQARRMIRPG